MKEKLKALKGELKTAKQTHKQFQKELAFAIRNEAKASKIAENIALKIEKIESKLAA